MMSGSFFLPAADTAAFMDKFRVTENYYYFTFTIRRRGRYCGRLFWLLEGSLELLYQIYIIYRFINTLQMHIHNLVGLEIYLGTVQ